MRMLTINIKYDTIVYWFIICYLVVTLLLLYLQDVCRDLYINVNIMFYGMFLFWEFSLECVSVKVTTETTSKV